MTHFEKQIRAARNRLTAQRYLDQLGVFLLVCLIIAAIAIFVGKLVELPTSFQNWTIGGISLAVGIAMVGAAVSTWLRRPDRLKAAAEVDHRLGLRERLASAIQLSDADRATPMGAAVIEDADAKAQRLDVRDAFPIRFSPRWAFTLIPAVAIAVTCFLPAWKWAEDQTPATELLSVTQINNSTQDLLKQIQQQRKAAEDDQLDEADFFKLLEDQLKDLRSNAPKEEKKFLVELKKIQEKLDERRQELGSSEDLKKQLAGLKKIDDGPAEKLADAMMESDLAEASEQMQDLVERMQRDELSKEEQKQLAKQLDQMKQALEEAAKAHEQAKDQLKEQIAQAEKSGDQQTAAKLSEQLQRMQQSDANMKTMAELAKSLSEASECLSKGDCKNAGEALSKMEKELSKMASDQKRAEQLKELSESLNQCKSCSSCQACNGNGCNECKGKSDKQSASDFAKGEGKGSGAREEAEDNTADYESQVRGNVGEGETAFGGKIAGKNKSTMTQSEVREAILASDLEQSDPIEEAELPKLESEASQQYFDALRSAQ